MRALRFAFDSGRRQLSTRPIAALPGGVDHPGQPGQGGAGERLELRPVYHRLEERICAHVLLRWPALLLVRVAENQAGATWTRMRRELDRIQIGTFTGPAAPSTRSPN